MPGSRESGISSAHPPFRVPEGCMAADWRDVRGGTVRCGDCVSIRGTVSGVLTAEGPDDRRLGGGMMGAIGNAWGRMGVVCLGTPENAREVAKSRRKQRKCGRRATMRRAGTPAGVRGCIGVWVSGGVAALDHRLRACIPPGCRRARETRCGGECGCWGNLCGHLRTSAVEIRADGSLVGL